MTRQRNAILALCFVSAYITTRTLGAGPDESAPVATSSSGEGHYLAAYAIDRDPATRWSSNFTDDEWWQVRFPTPRILAGLKIRWEAAFGQKYQVLLSRDGTEWTTAYEQTDGDGNTDLIFFRPTEAAFLRIKGLQRGTGWGYSIWEVEFFEPAQAPQVTATDAHPEHPPSLAVDGNLNTGWKSEKEDTQDLVLELPEARELGGVELNWGNSYASAYVLEKSDDGQFWSSLAQEDSGNGGRDIVYFPAGPMRWIRIRCIQGGASRGYEIAEVELKSGEEQATPIRHVQAAALDAPRGWYPRWLLREQEFWTITGVPDDDQESLLGETGVFEPYKGGFSVLPVFVRDGKIITWADVTLNQRLAENMLPLPSVEWIADSWSLDISAVSFGSSGQSVTAVRYRFANKSPDPVAGQLALLVRPVQLNPAWQYGGFSPLREVSWKSDTNGSVFSVDSQPRIFCADPPATFFALPHHQRDASEHLVKGPIPRTLSASDPDGMTSAAFLYDINAEPGTWKDVVLYFPLHGATDTILSYASSGEFDARWAQEADRWRQLLATFSIQIQEPRLIQVMKSNIAYILLNQDGPWIKPGPRNYNHSWMRDGAMTSVALLRAGFPSPVSKYLEAYSSLVTGIGWVPWIVHEGGKPAAFNANGREGQEYDSQGQFMYLVRQYFDYTREEEFLDRIYPSVVKAMDFAKALRRERMTDEYRSDPAKQAYYGILPESNSHEGYYPAMHSYWDDFWLLRGLQDGAYLARRAGHPEVAGQMTAEENDLRRCLYDSMLKVIERDHLDYLPGCVEKGDFDATSTSIAIMTGDEEEQLPQPYARNTFDKYYANFLKRLQPGGAESYTPYEVRTAEAFVRLGQRDRALTMLREFAENAVRPHGWNHMAEVVHGRPRTPSYIGDMPHTWVGSGYIDAVRSLFVYEDEGKVVLAAGVDPAWLTKGVQVENLPTQFGPVSYSLQEQDGTIQFAATGSASSPGGFLFSVPDALKVQDTRINDMPAQIENGAVRFQDLPVKIQLKLAPEEKSSSDKG